MKLYVKAKSKKEVNEKLAKKEQVFGQNFSFFGNGGIYELNSELPKDTVITIYEKISGGNPVGKAYGIWDGSKVR